MTLPPEYPYGPRPPRRRKKWPWVLGSSVVAFFVLVVAAGVSAGGNSGTTGGHGSTSGSFAGSPASTVEPTPESGPVRLAFGESHTWRGGETILVSPPREHKESNQFLAAPSGKRYVALDVSVRNNGNDEYQVMSTKLTVQHAGRVAQQNYMAGDPLPDVQLPPGGETTFTEVYEISDETGELQVSVQPNMFAADTVYFTGQF